MKYLILTQPSENYAKEISKFLYALSVPTQDQTTKYFNSWATHPTTGQVALVFGNEDIPIHPQADAKLIVDSIRGAITQDEAIIMEVRINEGGRINPLDFIPSSLASNLLTREEADAQGWFPVEEII